MMRRLGLTLLAQLRVMIRKPQVLALALMMPVLITLFFGELYVNTKFGFPPVKAINFLLPQYCVLAVMTLAFNTIGIGIAETRGLLILKRIGGTPLPRGILLVAMVISATLLVIAAEIVLIALGILVFGAEIKGSYALVLVLLLLGILFFASMGIVSGGLLPPATVPAANPLIFLALGFIGGVFIPIQQFPSGLSSVAKVTPTERVIDMLQQVAVYDHGLNSQIWQDVGVLGIWFVVVVGLGVRYFKWE
jgi:ABC-2 type transport system permease protein